MPDFPTDDRFTFDFLSITPSEVFSEISALDTSKACGPDGICPSLMREGTAELAKPLADIFNKSLSDGVLPSDWVSANTSLLFLRRVASCLQLPTN